jgi:hydroxymethylbilane synthase
MPVNKIVLGTRGSELARAQARLVEKALRSAWPDLAIETRVIKTSGDKSPNEKLSPSAGKKGLFTREIEEALLRSEIDLGVHSAKDLPSDSPSGMEICAALPRANVEDVLVMKTGTTLDALLPKAKIATGSVRRKHQLLWKRADLHIVDVRGNVPTRLRKLMENDWNGIVLARAGLERLGYDLSEHSLHFEEQRLAIQYLHAPNFLPAGGQGVIALEVRQEDAVAGKYAAAINHLPTFSCLRAEREFLRLLQVDCNAPVGVFAAIDSGMMTLRVQVFSESANEPKTGEVRFSLEQHEPEAIAMSLHAMMYGEV